MEWKAGRDLTMDLRRSAYEMLEKRVPAKEGESSGVTVAVRRHGRLSRSTVDDKGSIFTLEGDYVERILDVVSVCPRGSAWATPRCSWLASVKALRGGEMVKRRCFVEVLTGELARKAAALVVEFREVQNVVLAVREESTGGSRDRPSSFDVILGFNELAYGSFTLVDGTWIYGLFARVAILAGTVICRYSGRATRDGGHDVFTMSGTSVADEVSKLVINGAPGTAARNLGCFAAHSHRPNATFIDDFKFEVSERRAVHTNVVLVAGNDISEGTEIRVDHEGCEGRLQVGDRDERSVSAWSSEYCSFRWRVPDGVGESRTSWEAAVSKYWKV
eukprot:1879432-Prymnesium_polylepis.1